MVLLMHILGNRWTDSYIFDFVGLEWIGLDSRIDICLDR